jgi:acylphosphatase
MADTAKHIIFKGRVQGVGFRYTAHRIALRYELTGYVRNLADGSVEMFAQGHPDDIEDCLADINESFARYIRDRHITPSNPDPRCTDFTITF